MINADSNHKKMTAPIAQSKNGKHSPSMRSYKQLNVPTFAAVGFLLSFVTFQVGHNVVQSLETPASTGNSNTVTTAPSSSDPFSASDYNNTGSYDDGSNFNSNTNNNSYGYSSGALVNPPSSYSQPLPRTKHS